MITRNAWSKYINILRKLNDKAAEEMIRYQKKIAAAGFSGDEAAALMVEYAYGVATKYGEGAAAVACEMYDAIAIMQGAAVPAAVPAQTATYGETAKTVRGALKDAPITVPSAVARLVKTAGVDTTMKNAIRDGAEWAWIPSGDSCNFCLILASQGWVRASEKVLKGGHAQHIHNNCDCTFAIRHDGESTIDGYDPDALREIYDNAEGRTWREKLRYLDRQSYAKKRETIQARKRIEYKARKARETVENTGSDGIMKTGSNTDFYAGPNRKVMEAKYSEWIGDSKRDDYLRIGEDEHFINVIDKLYRPGSFIGDGGTGDALRFEKHTGIYLGKNGSHLQKAKEMTRYIRKKIMPRNLSADERSILTKVLNDLEEAIKEFET